jgi:hypothetical protein
LSSTAKGNLDNLFSKHASSIENHEHQQNQFELAAIATEAIMNYAQQSDSLLETLQNSNEQDTESIIAAAPYLMNRKIETIPDLWQEFKSGR